MLIDLRHSGHNSAFDAIQTELVDKTILLNGIGDVTKFGYINTSVPRQPYTMSFESGKRYLLRIINTSFSSTFNFTIDNHELQVVEADFVPILNYTTKSILVAIGQRYHVIVNADPVPDDDGYLPTDGNFWVRTWEAQCNDFNAPTPAGAEKTGIIRYNITSTAEPCSCAWTDSDQGCVDENNLQPVYAWNVSGLPANGPAGQTLGVNRSNQPDIYPLASWTLTGADFNPFAIDYSDPTFLKLNYSGKWDPLWVVLTENYTASDWVRKVCQVSSCA